MQVLTSYLVNSPIDSTRSTESWRARKLHFHVPGATRIRFPPLTLVDTYASSDYGSNHLHDRPHSDHIVQSQLSYQASTIHGWALLGTPLPNFFHPPSPLAHLFGGMGMQQARTGHADGRVL